MTHTHPDAAYGLVNIADTLDLANPQKLTISPINSYHEKKFLRVKGSTYGYDF